ncbi:MAG: hypothetical protein AMXMBFR33_08760 [Candidatus Xenobia bacterium]
MLRPLLCLILCLQLLLAAGAQDWSKFQPPDKSFSIDFPGTPALASNDPRFNLWALSEPGQFAYMAGYASFPGYKEMSAKEKQSNLEDFLTGMTQKMTGVKRANGPGSSVDLEGKTANGQQMKIRVVPAPEKDKLFVIMTTGQCDHAKFVKSFKQ